MRIGKGVDKKSIVASTASLDYKLNRNSSKMFSPNNDMRRLNLASQQVSKRKRDEKDVENTDSASEHPVRLTNELVYSHSIRSLGKNIANAMRENDFRSDLNLNIIENGDLSLVKDGSAIYYQGVLASFSSKIQPLTKRTSAQCSLTDGDFRSLNVIRLRSEEPELIGCSKDGVFFQCSISTGKVTEHRLQLNEEDNEFVTVVSSAGMPPYLYDPQHRNIMMFKT